MKSKEFFDRVRQMNQNIEHKRLQIAGKKLMTITDESDDDIKRMNQELKTLESNYEELVEHVEGSLILFEDVMMKDIFRKKYIEFKSVRTIADELYVSNHYIYMLINKGLNQFQEVLNNVA